MSIPVTEMTIDGFIRSLQNNPKSSVLFVSDEQSDFQRLMESAIVWYSNEDMETFWRDSILKVNNTTIKFVVCTEAKDWIYFCGNHFSTVVFMYNPDQDLYGKCISRLREISDVSYSVVMIKE
jgi:hypothetical protein